jgi:Tfp pilus assembly protein PilZ
VLNWQLVTSRRQHPRFALEVSVSVRAPDITLSGRTGNLSRGGFCVDLEQSVPLGQEVLCDLSLPALGASMKPLTIPARIVWCTPIDNRFQFGVQWGPMDKKLAADLEQFLALQSQSRPG